MAVEPIFNAHAGSKLPFTKRDIVRFLFKHKAVIVGTFILGLVLSGVAGWLIPVFYAVTGKVLIKQELTNMPSFFSGIASVKDEPTTQETLTNRVQNATIVGRSGVVVVPTVRELRLSYDQVALRWYKYLTDPILDGYYWFNVHVLGFPPDLERRGQNVVIDQFTKSLDVEVANAASDSSSETATPGSETSGPSIVSFTLTVTNPDKGVHELVLLIRRFIDYESSLQGQAAKDAYAFVEHQTERARARLDKADAALKRFEAQEGVTAVVNVPLTPVENGTSYPGLISTPQDSTTISLLKSRLVAKEGELVNLRERFRGRSPDIVSVLNSMQDIKTRIDREQAQIAANNATMLGLSGT